MTACEARLGHGAAAAVRTQIALHGGNEVCFVCTVDADGMLVTARKVAAGDVSSVLALPGVAERGEMLLHNHPSGNLTPSDADLSVAARMHENGVGFAITDNAVTRVYVVTEVPRGHEAIRLDLEAIDSVLGPDGLVAAAMQKMAPRPASGPEQGVAYEDRPSQRAMAEAVAATYNDGGVALLEAGTGVGKSLGYLVPALRWAAANNERTVVSTATITLQEQLVRRDLPFLSRALSDQSVKFALLKGWHNYVCLQRLDQAVKAGSALFDSDAGQELETIAEWAAHSSDGSLADLSFTPRAEVWDEVAAEPDLCTRLKCPFYSECFFFKARRQAAAADVVVANHHLLLSDVAVRRQMQNWEESAVLPAYKHLVVDEGHHLEDAAAAHLGSSITRRALSRLLNRLERRGRGLLPLLVQRLSARDDLLSTASMDLVRGQLLSSVFTARERAQRLFESLAAVLERDATAVLRLTDTMEARSEGLTDSDGALGELLVEIEAIGKNLTLVQERLEVDETRAEELAPLLNEMRAVIRRLRHAGVALMQGLLPPPDDRDVVRWIEFQGKPGAYERNIAVHCVPLDLAHVLRDDLFGKVESAVVTSATLATDGGFHFLEERLGLSGAAAPARTAIFPSPFDYPHQAVLAVPTDLPAPNEQPQEHFLAVATHLADLAAASDGGIFGLFTSHRDLREMAALWREAGHTARWPLLVHGEEPRDLLLERFRDSGRAVLLGTATFWEGVDVPGMALRGLLIARLPFRVPTEPLVAAQCEAIDERGGNAFMEYMLPHAALRLKQGFGRLIRTASDSGVVVLSDPRVVRKRYGRALLAGLPPAARIGGPWSELREQINSFYRNMQER